MELALVEDRKVVHKDVITEPGDMPIAPFIEAYRRGDYKPEGVPQEGDGGPTPEDVS